MRTMGREQLRELQVIISLRALHFDHFNMAGLIVDFFLQVLLQVSLKSTAAFSINNDDGFVQICFRILECQTAGIPAKR